MDRKFEYRGDLAATPLPEILATIHRYRVPGVLSVSRGDRRRRIHIAEGLVIFATSNEREASLGMHLLKHGVLNRETALEAEARRVQQGLRLGQVILQMGLLTPERLNEAIGEQIREILWGAFDWDGGEVVFDLGSQRDAELVRIDLPIPDVILSGIRRAADVRRLVHRLGSAQTLLEKTPNSLLALFSPLEKRFHDAIDGRTTLQTLCNRGPGSAAENARVLYAFYCFGLLRPQRTNGARKLYWRTEGGGLG